MKYCRMCGTELKDEAKFCAKCGTAVIEPAQPETAAEQAVEEAIGIETKIEDTVQSEMFQQTETISERETWQEPARPVVPFLANPIFLGILFLVSGILMLVLPTIPVMDMIEVNMYGVTYIAGATVTNNVITGFESWLFQAPALIAIVTGIALVQKRKGAFKLAMLGGIFQLLAAIGTLLFMVLILVFAAPLVQIYVWDAETVAVGTQMLKSEGLSRFAMVELPILLLGVASFVFTLIARGKERKTGSQVAYDLFGKMPRSAVALIILIPFITLFIFLKTMLGTWTTGYFAGNNTLAAFSIVSSVISKYTIPVLYLIAAIIVYCMLGYKWKYWVLSVPGMGVLLIYSIIVIIMTLSIGREMLVMMNTPAEIWDTTQFMMTPQVLAQVMLPLAFFFWIAATARGCIPAWLQAILAPVVVIFYIAVELLLNGGWGGFAHMQIPASQYVIYLIILVFAIPIGLACKPKKG